MKKSRGIALDALMKYMSPSALELNRHLFEASGKTAADPASAKVVPAVYEDSLGKTRTQSESMRRMDTLNKTERRYYDTFLADDVKEGVKVFAQAPRFFELTGGGTYTPDFMILRDYGLEVVEIKGGYCGPGWEQGIERYRRVCSQYDCDAIRFKMATWDRKKREWKIVDWARH